MRPLEPLPFTQAHAGKELDLVTRDAAIGTGALTGLLVVWNAADNQLDVRCACGPDPSHDRLSIPATQSAFLGRAFESPHRIGEPISPEENPHLDAASSGSRVTYAAGAPVRPSSGPGGALCVGLPAQPPDAAATLWVLESYARLAALWLHDPGALDGLLAAARHDTLTGCLNQSAIRSELEREIARCARHGRSLSCCFVDLDGFKQVNDRHGHLLGSRMLAEVAAILRAGVRGEDRVGRYGGDEFIVVLPDTAPAAAHALAERLRSQICSATVPGGHESLNASVGVAHWQAGDTGDDLLAAADEALRTAKLVGGGTVETAADAATGARGASASPGC